MNRAILFGRLGADPELRHTNGGGSVLNLRLATTDRFKGKDGTWQERTDWHAVTVWGARGESLAKLLRKGSQVLVDGSLRTSSYEKNGEKRFKTEVIANEVELGPKNDEAPKANAQRSEYDEIPF